MQVRFNNDVEFGYKFNVTRSRLIKRHPEVTIPIEDCIRGEGIRSRHNPYGKNTNLKVVIQALDLSCFWDACKFRKRIRPETPQYQFSIKFYNSADTFSQRMKKLAGKVRAFLQPNNPKYKHANKPIMVVKGSGSSIALAVQETIDHLSAIARSSARK